MKTKNILAVISVLSLTLFVSISHATWITAIGSGTWGDTNIWDSGTVPGTNDFAEVDSPFNITVETNALTQYIIGSGTVTMAANSTLEITDPGGANGTDQLAALNTSATGNTVIYSGNPFWAKECDYYNLTFRNTNDPAPLPYLDFNNFSRHGATPMTIAGDMSVIGKIRVQQGANFNINGSLLLTTNASWDCSVSGLTVISNLTLGAGALLIDLDAANGSNYFGGNVLVNKNATGWNLTDVITWGVGGSLTNNGTIVGRGYGSITFSGTGFIAGSNTIKIPTITVNGIYTIGTTITLTTNTPTLNGTLVFDLAKTNKIILQSYLTNPLTLYYSGNLNVINSGAVPLAGSSYKFFTATNYGGSFTSTSFPTYPGLNWVDNLATSGSIAVVSAIVGSPTLALSRSGGVLTLSWDSTTYPGYSVQAQTNSAGIHSSWSATGSGTTSPYTVTVNPANPPVFFRLSNP